MGFEALNASRAAERVKDSGAAYQSVSTTLESVMLASRVMSGSRWTFAVAAMIRSNWVGGVSAKPSRWLRVWAG